MSAVRRDEPEQEQEISIRQRGHELFRSDEERPASTTRPFEEYLRETPSAPLPTWVQALLWALAVVVALLFAVALWRAVHRTKAQPRKSPRPTRIINRRPPAHSDRRDVAAIEIAIIRPSSVFAAPGEPTIMTTSFAPFPRLAGATLIGLLALGASVPVQAQTQAPTTVAVDGAVRAIDKEYNAKLLELERDRLSRLQRLASERQPKEAAVVYEQLFRLAIANNLFVDAEPAADAVIKAGSPSPTSRALARMVKLIAECDRGAYDQSLTDLGTILAKADKAGNEPSVTLAADELIQICDAYYQRLVQAGRFDVARKAFQLAVDHAQRPAVKSFLESRLTRLKLIGEPAAPIQGVDLDGKPFRMADVNGKAVLVVFWATWCLPNAAETEWLQQAYETYHPQGLEIVGVNLDLMQDEAPKLESLLPNIRRFVFDYNVRWPTLVNGPADGDVAKAYGVTEIPANVLIDRDGKVAAIDLTRKNFESTVAKLIGR